ncbi:acetyl-CoA C-acetyltransferase [Rhodococcus qingshengii]|uniref:acetyl-CoA C-acetyltransferase n=1 Tax=Rhodococcus qingshengii TaxID=334542 RepID=UPI001E5E559D|nr:acetyl-CoA C-acetyltransferase [Rhodococcus qingshengii]MCQ4150587.1 acetyl-CoA C-acetyltransferase [Rhodococcus qingshengii]UGQ55425.1 acetyl-CoA C-acetyltransferase [Rhodococcus qingshengii]
MSYAYIVDAVRTPVGRKGGALSSEHPVDVAAHVLEALMARTQIDPSAVDDVVFGATDTVGPAAGDIARLSWLAAGLPESVAGVTLDRQCGSSQQAVHFAAQAVMSGTQDIVVAGGVQLMSVVPINHAWTAGKGLVHEDPFATSKRWQKRYGSADINQFLAAEMIAEKWGLDRATMEDFALRSHERALSAIENGYFSAEIEPYGDFAIDECPRHTSLEKMAKLPTLSEGGRITAALASQISDGAAALLVCSEGAMNEHGLTPRARIHTLTVAGDDPLMMLTAPIPATRKALRRAGLAMSDIDLIEINEAFASVVLAWEKELEVDPDRVNVNGGAIALGHPIGASGARLMTSMLSELERREARFALQTMCEGGGQANVTIIERV